jgi:hypothetical protein
MLSTLSILSASTVAATGASQHPGMTRLGLLLFGLMLSVSGCVGYSFSDDGGQTGGRDAGDGNPPGVGDTATPPGDDDANDARDGEEADGVDEADGDADGGACELDLCDNDSDCRSRYGAGFACSPNAFGPGCGNCVSTSADWGSDAGDGADDGTACPGEAGCRTDFDCSAVEYCQRYGGGECGQCVPASTDSGGCSSTCQSDLDCGTGYYCAADYEGCRYCEYSGYADGTEYDGYDFDGTACGYGYGGCYETSDCPNGQYCDLTQATGYGCGVCQSVCTTDADCRQPGLTRCQTPTGMCVPPMCSSDTQCPAGQVCNDASDGLSATCGPPPQATVAGCRLVSPDSTLAIGGSLTLSAFAAGADGRAVPRVSFTFNSSDLSVAVVNGGTIKALTAGTATVTATAASPSGSIACDGAVVIRVLPAAAGLRVVALDRQTGAPVAGAAVRLTMASNGAPGDDSAVTDSEGLAQLSIPASAASAVHVTAIGYTGLSVFTTLPETVRLLLDKEAAPARIPATMAFRPGVTKEMLLGLGGFSLSRGLTSLGIGTLFGQPTPVQLDCSSLGFNDSVLLGEGGVLAVPPDLCTGAKTTFIATAPPGPRVLWGMAGWTSINDVLPVIVDLGAYTSGGTDEAGWASVVGRLFGLMRDYDHGLDLGWNLAAGQTGPAAQLPLSSAMSLGTIVRAPRLATLGGVYMRQALLVGGVADPVWGFVPLGLGIGSDSVDGYGYGTTPPDGIVSPEGNYDVSWGTLQDGELPAYYSRAHGGLEGRGTYVHVLISTTWDQTTGTHSRSGLVQRGATIPSRMDFSGTAFPPIAEGATWTPSTRAGSFGGVSGATPTLRRMVLAGPAGRHVVYAPGAATAFALPSSGEGAPDLAGAGLIEADGLTLIGATLTDLFDARSQYTVGDIDTLVTSFSVWEPEP